MRAEFEFNGKLMKKKDVMAMFGSAERFKAYFTKTRDLFHEDPRINNGVTINGGTLKCHFVL